MSIVALWQLARPTASADRRRWLLVAGACALTGLLLLTGARILRYQTGPLSIAPYVEQGGLRSGVLTAVVLCCLPPLVLLVQALRVGSAARERRLIALRVAGASNAQLARLAMLEGASAGLAGAVAGGLLYLLLGWTATVIPTVYLRLVPPADLGDLVRLPVVAVVLALLAGLSARVTAHEVTVAPRRVSGRAPCPLARRRAAFAVLLLLLVLALLLLTLWGAYASIFLLIAAAVLLLFVAAPYLVLLAAGRLSRSTDPMAQLAAARIRSDPRTPGRIAAVVGVCGVTFSIAAAFIADVIATDNNMGDSKGFYLSGALLAAAAAVIALAVSVLSLIVAAAEQVLDARRATATLTAFGVSCADLTRALRRQLSAVTVPAALTGAVLGAALSVFLFRGQWAAGVLVGPLLAVAVGSAAARGAARLLAPQVAESTSAESLRTA